jgi:hypothetical protein
MIAFFRNCWLGLEGYWFEYTDPRGFWPGSKAKHCATPPITEEGAAPTDV